MTRRAMIVQRSRPRTPDGPASTVTPMDTRTACTAAIVAISILAWLYMVAAMGDMDQGPGTPLHDFPTFLIGWVIMLTAMMLPSEITYVNAYALFLKGGAAPPRDRFANVLFFIAGYGVVWTAYGAAAFLLDSLLRVYAPPFASWSCAGPLLAGLVLIVAGLYQVSPLKQACLTHCRSPISHLTRHWHPGPLGALRMGASHGLVCVGCCWALMAVIFAVGAMSLVWMGLLTLLMFAEKILPLGGRLTVPIAALLCAMGIWIAVSPATAPLLKEPLQHGLALPATSCGL